MPVHDPLLHRLNISYFSALWPVINDEIDNHKKLIIFYSLFKDCHQTEKKKINWLKLGWVVSKKNNMPFEC